MKKKEKTIVFIACRPSGYTIYKQKDVKSPVKAYMTFKEFWQAQKVLKMMKGSKS